MEFSLPTSLRIWRIDSRKGRLSMSPTVPPISMIATSTSWATRRMTVFDLVGDVRNHLNRLAEKFPFPLLFNHGLVDLARGGIVFLGQPDVREPLVMAQVQIGFRAVIGYKNLAMLERTHGARVHVDVGIQLEEIDFKPAGLEQAADRGARQPLAQR